MKKSQRTASSSRKVYLRHPVPSDFDELAERYSGSLELSRGVASTKFDRKSFDELVTSANTETKQSFVICRVDGDAIVGTITLSQIFRKAFQNAYLGYQLFGGFTGNGYMAEAVGLMLRQAFIDL